MTPQSALGLVALVGDQDHADGDPEVEDAMDTDEDFTDVEPVSAHEASERRAELAKAASSLCLCVATTPTLRSSRMPSVTRRKRVQSARRRLPAPRDGFAAPIGREERLAEVTKSGDALHAKRARLVDRSEAAVRNCSKSGPCPSARSRLSGDLPEERLVELLATCHQDRAKFSKVNKKALDQFVAFADQRSGLLDRARELDEGAKAILSLLSNLTPKKMKPSKERTFEASHQEAPRSVLVRRSAPGRSIVRSTGAGGAKICAR